MTWLSNHFLNLGGAAVAAAVAVPLLVLLYFLKLRRRLLPVSTTLLWRKAVQDLQVNAPFQKIRNNLLLWIQLLLLAALLIALARPIMHSAGKSGRRMILAIDNSASMNATDVAPSRLEHAKQVAIDLVDQFEGDGGIMLVSFARNAQVIEPFTTDREALRAKIRAIQPTDHLTQLAPALQLIEPYALTTAAGASKDANQLSIYVLSDGRPKEAGGDLLLRGGELHLVPIGQDASKGPPDNVAIVSLAARRDFEKPQKVQIYGRIANYGGHDVQTGVTLWVDGLAQKTTPIDLPAGTAKGVYFDLVLASNAVVKISHSHDDVLASDNSASLVLAPPQSLRVLLVTEGDAFVERAVKSVSGIKKVELMTPKRYEDQSPATLRRGAGNDEGFDVLVFDGYSPSAVPPVDSLYLGAAPPIRGLKLVPGSDKDTKTQAILNWDRDDPILRYAALDDVAVMEPGRLVLPPTAKVLATTLSGPVMAEVNANGLRHVITSFSMLKSVMPMQVPFVVFMTNAVQELALGGAGGAGVSFEPGEVVIVPTSGEGVNVHYSGPEPLDATSEKGRATLPGFPRAGVYEAAKGVSSPWDKLAVNITDENESNLAVATKLDVGTMQVKATSEIVAVRREVWRWFIWAALALVCVEWVAYAWKSRG